MFGLFVNMVTVWLVLFFYFKFPVHVLGGTHGMSCYQRWSQRASQPGLGRRGTVH